jgi:hypothetical protein
MAKEVKQVQEQAADPFSLQKETTILEMGRLDNGDGVQ